MEGTNYTHFQWFYVFKLSFCPSNCWHFFVNRPRVCQPVLSNPYRYLKIACVEVPNSLRICCLDSALGRAAACGAGGRRFVPTVICLSPRDDPGHVSLYMFLFHFRSVFNQRMHQKRQSLVTDNMYSCGFFGVHSPLGRNCTYRIFLRTKINQLRPLGSL
jgi:hypothetical protein